MHSLQEELRGSLENVVIFIADSVRYDHLPDTVKSQGTSFRGIAPSTYTASSIPSILTSTYPPEHKIWHFSDRLSREPYLFAKFPNSGVNVSNVWGKDYEDDEKPTLKMLNLDANTTLDMLDTPFAYVIHDHGGHQPYGEDEDQFGGISAHGFFKDHRDDQPEINRLYREGIDVSTERFINLRQRLEENGLLDDTLLIYTSDHGQILGEFGGIYGHNHPMTPGVLEVPIVFSGGGIERGKVGTQLVSSVDVVPTALRILDYEIPQEMVGADLTGSAGTDRIIRSDVWKRTRFGELINYKASSVWSDNGGVVINRSNIVQRMLFGLGLHYYRASHAPIVRNDLFTNSKPILNYYLKKRVEFGSYDGSYPPGRLLESRFERGENSGAVDVDAEQLRALGYLE